MCLEGSLVAAGEGEQRGGRNLLGVMDVFIIYIVVMISRVYANIKTDQVVRFTCSL